MAQRRRRQQQIRRRQRMTTILCVAGGLGAALLSLVICLMVFDFAPDDGSAAAPQTTALPYQADAPFTVSDLTAAQIMQIREKGRIMVSDGPRGISIGDTLEELLDRYPSTFAAEHGAGRQTSLTTDEEMLSYYSERLDTLGPADQTGLQSDEEMILYCAEYFVNQNGASVALPPRGLLNVRGGSIVVTLLAPTAAYPAGTQDNYGSYEHVYCVYTIEPDTMTVSNIVLGIDQ